MERCELCPNKNYDIKATAEAAKKFKPLKVKVLFVLESPPDKSELRDFMYFYFTKSSNKYQPLYEETMKLLFKEFDRSKPKSVFLRKFQRRGFFIIDAAKCPVNKVAKRDRNKIIECCAEKHLVKEIKYLRPQKIIVVKSNVFRRVKPLLEKNGIKTTNTMPIPFPAFGNQGKFRKEMERYV